MCPCLCSCVFDLAWSCDQSVIVSFSDSQTCAAPNSSMLWSNFHLSVQERASPSDVKRDRETIVNSKLPRQCSRSSSGLFREVIINRDRKHLSLLNWTTKLVILSWVLKVLSFLFVIVDQIDSFPCGFVRTNSLGRFHFLWFCVAIALLCNLLVTSLLM